MSAAAPSTLLQCNTVAAAVSAPVAVLLAAHVQVQVFQDEQSERREESQAGVLCTPHR